MKQCKHDFETIKSFHDGWEIVKIVKCKKCKKEFWLYGINRKPLYIREYKKIQSPESIFDNKK